MVENTQGSSDVRRGQRLARRRERSAAPAPTPRAPASQPEMMRFNPVGAMTTLTPEQEAGLTARFGNPTFEEALSRAVMAASGPAPQAPTAEAPPSAERAAPARPSAPAADRLPTQMTGSAAASDDAASMPTVYRGTGGARSGAGGDVYLTGYQAKAFGPLLGAMTRTAGSVAASQPTPDTQEQFRSTILEQVLAAMDEQLAAAETPEAQAQILDQGLNVYKELYGTAPNAFEAWFEQNPPAQ